MKCERCGKFKMKTYQFYVKRLCKECLTELGFVPEDIDKPEYRTQPWELISKGKAEVDRILDERRRTKVIKINLGDVEDPKVVKILNGLKKELDPDELYGGNSIKDLKEYMDEEPHHIYGGIDFDCEVEREGDKASVIIDGKKVAETDYIEEMSKGDTFLIVNGGKYRQIEMEFDYDTTYKNVSGEDDYWLMLKIVYIEN